MIEWNSLPAKHKVGAPFSVTAQFLWSYVTKPNSSQISTVKMARDLEGLERLLLEIELMQMLKPYTRQLTGTWLLRCKTNKIDGRYARFLCKGITWNFDPGAKSFHDYFVQYHAKNQLQPPSPAYMIRLLRECLQGLKLLHKNGVYLRSIDTLSIELYGDDFSKIRFVDLNKSYLSQPQGENEAIWARENDILSYKLMHQLSPALVNYLLTEEENRSKLSISSLVKQDCFSLGALFYFAATMAMPYTPYFKSDEPITPINLLVIESSYTGVAAGFYPMSALFESILMNLLDSKTNLLPDYYLTLIEVRAKDLLT